MVVPKPAILDTSKTHTQGQEEDLVDSLAATEGYPLQQQLEPIKQGQLEATQQRDPPERLRMLLAGPGRSGHSCKLRQCRQQCQ